MKLTNRAITEKNKQYHDLIAPAYDTYKEQNHPKVVDLYQKLIDKVLKPNKKKGSLTILDFGCGTGFLEQFLSPQKNTIYGIDISKELLTLAKKKYPRVQYALTDVYTFKSSRKYDLIVGNAILHHLKDYNYIIKKLISNLKPGGNLFIGAEPNYFCYRYMKFFKDLFRQVLPDKRKLKTENVREKLEQYAEYHMYFSNGINPFILKQQLLTAGFEKVEITFSSRELAATLIDRMQINVIDYIPNLILDNTFLLSRIFYINAFGYNPKKK